MSKGRIIKRRMEHWFAGRRLITCIGKCKRQMWVHKIFMKDFKCNRCSHGRED